MTPLSRPNEIAGTVLHHPFTTGFCWTVAIFLLLHTAGAYL